MSYEKLNIVNCSVYMDVSMVRLTHDNLDDVSKWVCDKTGRQVVVTKNDDTKSVDICIVGFIDRYTLNPCVGDWIVMSDSGHLEIWSHFKYRDKVLSLYGSNGEVKTKEV